MAQAEKFGIEKLTMFLFFLAGLAQTIEGIFGDGKVTVFEVLTTLPKPTFEIQAILENDGWEQLKLEISDLSSQEWEELTIRFAERFDLQNDEAEAVVEELLAWGGQTFTLGKRLFKKENQTV